VTGSLIKGWAEFNSFNKAMTNSENVTHHNYYPRWPYYGRR